MKATQSLIVALLLGVTAAAFNWIYLEKKASEFQVEQFLGIRDGVEVRVGETLLESHFQQVPVPKRYGEKLKKFVFLYREKGTAAGIKATRDYEGGDLVHREDYKTPATAIKLKPDERLIWVAVESRAFVPALVNPGDEVTFVFPVPGPPGSADQQEEQTTAESLGPFKIGALGTRLGDMRVSRAYRSSRAEERQIGIVVQVEGGKLEGKALRLLELTTAGNRAVAVALHPQQS
jgi:hypothetical protein